MLTTQPDNMPPISKIAFYARALKIRLTRTDLVIFFNKKSPRKGVFLRRARKMSDFLGSRCFIFPRAGQILQNFSEILNFLKFASWGKKCHAFFQGFSQIFSGAGHFQIHLALDAGRIEVA